MVQKMDERGNPPIQGGHRSRRRLGERGAGATFGPQVNHSHPRGSLENEGVGEGESRGWRKH